MSPLRQDLGHLLKEIEKFGRADERMKNIPPETGRFLRILAQAHGSKRLLEVGTANGYSALWLGEAARTQGGRVWTIERDPPRVQLAWRNIERAGLSEVIEVLEGDARQVLRTLEGPFDLVFLDGEKVQYQEYWSLVYPKLAEGGLLVADNAGTHAREMADYLETVRSHPRMESVFVPIGSGLELSLKLGATSLREYRGLS